MGRDSEAKTRRGASGGGVVRVAWVGRIAWVAWGALLLFLAILLLSSWQGPDIFYHLELGKRVLQTGHAQPPEQLLRIQPRYVNVYWLYQVVNQSLYAMGGPVAVSLFMMGVWIGFFLLCVRIAGGRKLPALGLPLTLASILVVQGRFDPRPDAVAWLIAAVWILWLTTWDFSQRLSWKRLALAGALQIVWANTHGYFALGPLLAGAFLLAALFDPEGRARSGEIAKLLGVVVVASFLTPFGPKAWRFVFDLWRLGGQMRESVLEVRPPTGDLLKLWTVKLFWAYWGASILATGLLVWKKRVRTFPLLLLLAGLFLSARSVRYLPAVVLFSAPTWGLLAGGERMAPGGTTRRGFRLPLSIAGVVAVMAVAMSVWALTGGFYRSLSSPAKFGISLPTYAYPSRVAAYLKANGFSGKVFNESTAGGYLPYVVPSIRPYMDPRYVEPAPVMDYFAALRRRDKFETLQREFGFDGILLRVSESPELLQSLLTDPNWRLVYADLHRAFLVPANRSALPAKIRFYDGEDLTRLIDGRSAIEWTVLCTRLKDRARLLQVLDDLDRSPKIPSVVIQYALGYGMQTKDADLIRRGRGMYARMVANDTSEKSMVDRLMLATSDGSGAGR